MGIHERRTEQRQAVRERILHASRAIVEREGFAALSMRKIADAIAYSPAALYLHFESRADIARALRAEGHAQLRSIFQQHATIAEPAARLREMARAYVDFGLTHPETYRLMFMEPSGLADPAATLTPALALMADAFVELRAAGRPGSGAPPAEAAEALWANLHGIVALQLARGARQGTPAETLVELSLDAWCARAQAQGDINHPSQ
jgi:AcrR family transcriptional regulator